MATLTKESRVNQKPSKKELREMQNEIHDFEFDRNPAREGATAHDLRDMNALGIKPAFRRRFNLAAMIGFASTVVVPWQGLLIICGPALQNGGTGGLFWTYLFSLLAIANVYLSLSELSSMFPTAGGQYQWVAECAPPTGRHFLSYCVGWLLTIAWHCWLSGTAVFVGNAVKWSILLYHPDSGAAGSQWFPTLIAVILLFCGGLFNVYCVRKFPLLESIMFCLHVGSWFAIVVVLWVTSLRGHPEDVLFTFRNGGGWSSTPRSVIVGVITAWGCVIGYDSSVHMTENAKDASKTIPTSMMTSFGINSAMVFVLCVTVVFCAGNLDDVMSESTLAPFIVIFRNSTNKTFAVVMTVPMMLTLSSALISEVACSSKQLWSFARDGGVPFSKRLAPVHDHEVPRRAVWGSIALAVLCALINFASEVGFLAIVSLTVVALTASYSICIGTLLYRRCFGKPLPRERFSLGIWGAPINVVALACCAPLTVLSAFPAIPSPDRESMNWAPVMFGGVAVVSGLFYAVSGRKSFNPPTRKDS